MKRSRVNPISKKRLAQQEERRQLASPFEHEPCWIGTPRCTGWAQAWHELVGRAQGGSITDPRNLAAACNACNGWIEDRPAVAREKGWKVPQSESIATETGRVPKVASPFALASRWT